MLIGSLPSASQQQQLPNSFAIRPTISARTPQHSLCATGVSRACIHTLMHTSRRDNDAPRASTKCKQIADCKSPLELARSLACQLSLRAASCSCAPPAVLSIDAHDALLRAARHRPTSDSRSSQLSSGEFNLICNSRCCCCHRCWLYLVLRVCRLTLARARARVGLCCFGRNARTKINSHRFERRWRLFVVSRNKKHQQQQVARPHVAAGASVLSPRARAPDRHSRA